MDTIERDLKLVLMNITANDIEPDVTSEITTFEHESTDAQKDDAAAAKEACKKVWETKEEKVTTTTSNNVQITKVTTYEVKDMTLSSQKPEQRDKKYVYTYTVKLTKTVTRKRNVESPRLEVTKDPVVLKDATIGSATKNTTIRLDYITMNRQLYHPNEVIADIVFADEPTQQYLKDTFLGMKVQIVRYNKTKSLALTKDEEYKTEETLTGFYVYDIQPLKQREQDFCVRLHIFSLDHQLTRRKYCRTYVAKRLFRDILLEGLNGDSGEIKKIESSTDWSKTSPAYNTTPATLPFAFNTYFAANDEVPTTYDHLCAPIEDDNTTSFERIQPYLVQYNESFYEFMARTANRCGEFFFWDDGALRFGRTCDGATTLGKDMELVDEIEDSDCLDIYQTSVNQSSEFANTYYTMDDQNDIPQREKSSSSDSHPANYSGIKSELTPAVTEYSYNEEINHDVYRTKLQKGNFTTQALESHGNEIRYGLTYLSKALRATSLFKMIGSIGAWAVFNEIIAAGRANGINKRENKRQFPEDEDDTIKTPHRTKEVSNNKDSNKKYTYKSPFTSAYVAGHVNFNFYSTIRKREEELSGQLVVFNLANAMLLRIGNEITYNDNKYIVVQIKDNPATNPSLGSRFAEIEPDMEAPFKDMGNAVMQVVAIPVYSYQNPNNTSQTITEYYPPLRPEGHVRYSKPQKAFVADFHDPQKVGRVRIRYPWESSSSEASPWIQALAPVATPGGGVACELQIGDEVLIDYESGNIERPFVAGSMYNRQNPAPFRRGDMAIISKNGHGISFDDPLNYKKFIESMAPVYGALRFVGWLKDGGLSEEAGSDAELKLVGGTTISDAYGFYKIEMSTDQRKIDISCPFGKVNMDAFTGISIEAPNGDVNIRGQNISFEAGNNLRITSGMNVKNWEEYDKDVTGWKVAHGLGSFLEGVWDSIHLVDMDLLRKLVQVVLRPLNGTLEIKSYKYLVLEANGGQATIEANRYNKKSTRTNLLESSATKSDFAALANIIQIIDLRVNEAMDELAKLQGEVNAKIDDYDDKIGNAPANTLAANPPAGKDVVSRFFDTANGTERAGVADLKFDDFKHDSVPTEDEINTLPQTQAVADYVRDNPDKIARIKSLVTAAGEIKTKAKEYYDCYRKHHNNCDPATGAPGVRLASQAFDFEGRTIPATNDKDFITKYNDIVQSWVTNQHAGALIEREDFDTNHPDYKNAAKRREMKRTWFQRVGATIHGSSYTIGALNAANWATTVGGITCTAPGSSAGAKMGVQVVDRLFKDQQAIFHLYRDRHVWNDTGKNGQIILSDSKFSSFNFNSAAGIGGEPEGQWDRHFNDNAEDDDKSLAMLQALLHNWN